MGDTMHLVGRMVRSDVEAVVNILIEILVSKPWFSKGGDVWIPSACLEVEACKSSDGTSKRVADQDQLVVGILGESLGHIWQDDCAGVEPRRVEAGVDGTVVALGRICRGRVSVVAGLA